MIVSMTGFGKAAIETDNFSIEFNIKSVNNKGFDFNSKLPFELISFEQDFYKLAKSICLRGSIQIFCQFKRNYQHSVSRFKKSENIESYSRMCEDINHYFGNKGFRLNFSINQMINFIVKENKDVEFSKLEKNKINKIFKSALNDMVKSRINEGKNMEKDIKGHLSIIGNLLKQIKKVEKTYKKEYFIKFKKRVNSLLGNLGLDNERLYQELAIISEKLDISEELDRLTSHIRETKNYIKKENYPGKKINFICQEMLREINTIGSKSNNGAISYLVIDFKDNLGKIREQVQNII